MRICTGSRSAWSVAAAAAAAAALIAAPAAQATTTTTSSPAHLYLYPSNPTAPSGVSISAADAHRVLSYHLDVPVPGERLGPVSTQAQSADVWSWIKGLTSAGAGAQESVAQLFHDAKQRVVIYVDGIDESENGEFVKHGLVDGYVMLDVGARFSHPLPLTHFPSPPLGRIKPGSSRPTRSARRTWSPTRRRQTRGARCSPPSATSSPPPLPLRACSAGSSSRAPRTSPRARATGSATLLRSSRKDRRRASAFWTSLT